MRKATLISAGIALVLALATVFAIRFVLETQKAEALREAQSVVAATDIISTIVVASSSINRGEPIKADMLREMEWKSKEIPAGFFGTIEEVISGGAPRYAQTTYSSGEPIHRDQVTEPGEMAKLSSALAPNRKAISIRVNDVLGVAGFVLPGDHVDILLTRKKSDETFVDVLLQGVKVLAIDQLADARADAPSVVRTVTFEVSTEEAQILTLGANTGTVSLALRNVSDKQPDAAERVSLDFLEQALEVNVASISDERLNAADRVAALSDSADGAEQNNTQQAPANARIAVMNEIPASLQISAISTESEDIAANYATVDASNAEKTKSVEGSETAQDLDGDAVALVLGQSVENIEFLSATVENNSLLQSPDLDPLPITDTSAPAVVEKSFETVIVSRGVGSQYQYKVPVMKSVSP